MFNWIKRLVNPDEMTQLRQAHMYREYLREIGFTGIEDSWPVYTGTSQQDIIRKGQTAGHFLFKMAQLEDGTWVGVACGEKTDE